MDIRISATHPNVSGLSASVAGVQTRLRDSPVVRRVIEILAVISLSALVLSIHLPKPRINFISLLSLIVLMIWRFVITYKPLRTVPRFVVISSLLFFSSLLLSAMLSRDQGYSFFEYRGFKYFIIAGLLFTAPLRAKYKKFIITLFFISAALDGLAGILQYYGLLPLSGDRPYGFSPPATFYAAKLAFAAGAVIILLACGGKGVFTSTWGFFLLAVALLTWGGILLSGSRGTWLASSAAVLITLYLYNRRAMVMIGVVFSIVAAAALFFDTSLRSRAEVLVTLPAALSDVQNSSGNRVELWRGALSIFKEHPLLGTGAGDFQEDVEIIISEKRLKNMQTTVHAHNIFFQTLATQGIVGFLILSALLVGLIRWGLRELHGRNEAGGYMILFCALLVIFSGMTDYYFGSIKYFSACYIIIGLLGSDGQKIPKTALPLSFKNHNNFFTCFW